jgi:hypothetical protein
MDKLEKVLERVMIMHEAYKLAYGL